MKTWAVTLPITGRMVVEVEAENEDAAIEAALLSDYTMHDIDEWQPVKRITQGNVCYAMHPWSAEAEFVSDEDDGEPSPPDTGVK